MMEMILGGIILQGFFLSAVIMLNKAGGNLDRRLLSSLILVFTIILVAEFIKSVEFEGHIKLSNTFFLFDLILAPLTYLYAKSISRRKEERTSFIWPHLIFPLAINVVYLSYHFVTRWDQHILFEHNLGVHNLVILYSKIGYQIVYQVLAIYTLSSAIKQHKVKSYAPARIHLIRLVRGILLVVIVLLPLVIVLEDFYRTDIVSSDEISNLIMIFSIYSIGYIALKNPLVYARTIAFTSTRTGRSPDHGMSGEVMDRYLRTLKELMESDRLYTKPDLSLEELASAMSITRHTLSYVINDGLHQSFFDFINSYRLKDFEDRIRQGDLRSKNILALGLESGFNSKATLYRAFKKHHGMAPKEYLKNMK